MSQTITFREVAVRGQKLVKCAGGCNRTLKRQRKFWQTLSPFNKNADGKVKGQGEIHRELIAESKAWQSEPETCSHCSAKGKSK